MAGEETTPIDLIKSGKTKRLVLWEILPGDTEGVLYPICTVRIIACYSTIILLTTTRTLELHTVLYCTVHKFGTERGVLEEAGVVFLI